MRKLLHKIFGHTWGYSGYSSEMISERIMEQTLTERCSCGEERKDIQICKNITLGGGKVVIIS